MGYEGYNPLILTFDPNFLGHPSVLYKGLINQRFAKLDRTKIGKNIPLRLAWTKIQNTSAEISCPDSIGCHSRLDEHEYSTCPVGLITTGARAPWKDA